VAEFHELQPLLEQALAQESQDDTAYEMAVTARGLTKAAEVLSGRFTIVATNVPYLGSGKQNDLLKSYCERSHPKAKADLATCFIERCLAFCSSRGSTALVTPQNWLFLGTYKTLRESILRNSRIDAVCRLGPRAFETIGGEVVNVALSLVSRSSSQVQHSYAGIDCADLPGASEKKDGLTMRAVCSVNQALQLRNPQAAISFNNEEVGDLLEDIAESVRGLSPGDTGRVCRRSWEVPLVDRLWKFLSSTPDAGKDISGKTDLILDPELIRSLGILGFTYTGHRAWGRAGIVVGKVGGLPASIYLGEVYDDNIHAIMPKNLADLPAIWAFVSSDEFAPEVRKFNQKLAATVSAVTRIPFSLSYWQKVADEKYPNGLPKPFSSDPTQWLFSGHPVSAEQPLHVAVARLVGYQWPRQTGSSFPDCPALGPDGLEPLADEDGIVCLSPIRGEVAAADRLRALLASAFGDEWSNAKERELLLETAVANDARKAAADLGDWLRQSFFAEHCKLFQSRPFIWQIWDGNPYGFSALVNYHKLAAPKGQGRKTLELLTYTYLGDWIDRQKLDQAEGVNGADDRLAAALDLRDNSKRSSKANRPTTSLSAGSLCTSKRSAGIPISTTACDSTSARSSMLSCTKAARPAPASSVPSPAPSSGPKTGARSRCAPKRSSHGSGAGMKTAQPWPLISAPQFQEHRLQATASTATAGTTCTTPVPPRKRPGQGIGVRLRHGFPSPQNTAPRFPAAYPGDPPFAREVP
jgi:hypothetical protein